MNNRNNAHANIDRQRVADEVAREAPTSGAHGPPTKRSKPDPTMTVSTLELDAARAIKTAAEACTQYPLKKERWSEYDYAQQALTTTADLTDEDSIKDLMQNMYKLQCFREEYGIQDTVEEGVRLIQHLMERMPGFVLSVDFAPRYGSYIAVFDYAAFRPERLRMPDDMRAYLGAMYYIFQCLSTNLKAARSGAVIITECQGMKNENFDLQVEEKYISHLFGHYPFRHKECLWLNTPSIANVAYGLLKPMMPGDFLATWRMGCKLDGYEGRIDSLFKMPTLAIAQEQLLMRIQGFLTERGQNAGGFELHERMVCNPPPPPQPAAPGQAGAAGAGAAQGQAAQAQAPQRPQAVAAAQRPAGPAAPAQRPAAQRPQGPAAPAQGPQGQAVAAQRAAVAARAQAQAVAARSQIAAAQRAAAQRAAVHETAHRQAAQRALAQRAAAVARAQQGQDIPQPHPAAVDVRRAQGSPAGTRLAGAPPAPQNNDQA